MRSDRPIRRTAPIPSPPTPFEVRLSLTAIESSKVRPSGVSNTCVLCSRRRKAEIARCLAVALRANESLAEAITLAHDLGHPPFGHAGETALNQAMTDHGGFNHNAHSLRLVEYLEHPFPAFRGLNLTREVLAGLRTHNTRYDKAQTMHAGPCVESQIASLADRIAYDCHDLE